MVKLGGIADGSVIVAGEDFDVTVMGGGDR